MGFQDVQVFAPNLRDYEVEFNEEMSNDQMQVYLCRIWAITIFQLMGCNFANTIWSKLLSLTDLVKKCENKMKSLTINSNIVAEILMNKVSYFIVNR